MKLAFVHLSDFRNVTAQLTLAPGINVLVGRNGQGKSNVLEAIHVVATGRSFRPGKLADLVRFDMPAARVELTVEDDGIATPITLSLGASGERRLAVGGQDNSSLADVANHLRVIFFGPEDLHLVKGSPGGRRDFLDAAIAGHHPPYAERSRGYAKLLKERNQLLRDIVHGFPPPPEIVESYEDQLARHAAQILSQRGKFLREFAPVARRLVADHTDGRLDLELAYSSRLPELADPACVEAADIYPVFKQALARTRKEDAPSGRTSIGPHVDDLELSVNGHPARFFASQGEQRQLAVSLKVAQLALWKERFGVHPVLLLDDVLSELDPVRSRLLFSRVIQWGVQTLLTTTTKEDVVIEGDCRFFTVAGGQIEGE
jgi:DNA replication and repair protein RecF